MVIYFKKLIKSTVFLLWDSKMQPKVPFKKLKNKWICKNNNNLQAYIFEIKNSCLDYFKFLTENMNSTYLINMKFFVFIFKN